MRNQELDDPRPILRLLLDNDVRFVVIGGIASTLYGSPYPTIDLDICAADDADNLAKLSDVLRALNAKEWEPHKGEPVDREWSVEMLSVDRTWILVTDAGPFDILFEPAGTRGYRDLAGRRQWVELEGLRVPLASLEDIIRSKEAAGRERDLQQLPTLRKLLERRSQKGLDGP